MWIKLKAALLRLQIIWLTEDDKLSLLEIHSLTQTMKFWESTQIGAICDISQTTRNKLLPLCIPHIKQKTQ